MKKLFFAACAAIALVLMVMACQNPTFPTPIVPDRDGDADIRAGSPIVTATHGKKRGIELSWGEVSGAARYYIYRAGSPLENFALCAETTETSFAFSVAPGSTFYYRVSSVSSDGRESLRSPYVMGSSLAQPWISDITDITETSAAVVWYMDNATDATYKANLRYIVYCFDNGDEAANLAIDGSTLAENKATFANLLAGKGYSYQVEAFLVSDQENSEKSEIMDAETARRFRPGAPANFAAARGTSRNSIELSFNLPEMVNIALNANEYKMHGLYFVISKRLYSADGNNNYTVVSSYFGAENEAEPARAAINTFPGDYEFGKTVSWTDLNVQRGTEYEYLVQAYVDGTVRTISSEESKASASGWALAQGTLSIGKPQYTANEDGDLFISARLPLTFSFNPKGEEYRYAIVETVKPLEDAFVNDPDGEFERRSGLLSHEQIASFVATMNLAGKSSAASPGRGLYSYKAEIFLPDGTELVDTVRAIGDIQISEDIAPLILEEFYVQDGYTDKFLFKWLAAPDLDYLLFESTDEESWNQIMEYKSDSITIVNGYSTAEIDGYDAGETVYFAMQPIRELTQGFDTILKKGQRVYLRDGSRTLGVPELTSLSGNSYSTVSVEWAEAQKADTYRIKYKYDSDLTWKEKTVPAGLSLDVNGKFSYQFNPEGYNDAAKSGLEMQIKMEALNKGLQTAIGSSNEILTVSEEAAARLVGPAKLGVQASKAEFANYIEVSWNKVAGADGYYVFRRQFNMDNTVEEGAAAIVYYIPTTLPEAAGGQSNVTGKNLVTDATNTKTDTNTVEAEVSWNGQRFTLQDKHMADAVYTGAFASHDAAYRNQQNMLAWGYPYRYYVVPVISRGGQIESLDAIEFRYASDPVSGRNTAIAGLILDDNGTAVSYSSSAASLEQEGFAIGFGQNVVATKGTYSSKSDGNNDGIRITWDPPPRLAAADGFSPRYILYRRATGGSWEAVTTNFEARVYEDNPQTRGVAYEYAVGIANGTSVGGSQPQSSQRFIDQCYTLLDDRNRPKMLGFMLNMVKMESVSRGEIKVGDDFAEEVKWYSAGVKNSASSGDLNWGIDGYTVYVMNRNIDGNWHEIADITNISNQTNQSFFATNSGGLLKVLRDYKHFFKVRSYVLNDGEKMYSPDPTYDYEALYAADRSKLGQDAYRADTNKLQTEYVKWGARQVTHTEYVRIAMLAMAWGIHDTNGSRTGWVTATSGRTYNTNGNNGSSGSVRAESSSGVGMWWFDFRSYRPDMDTNANRGDWSQSVTFVTIDTNSNSNGNADQRKRTIYAEASGSSQYPRFYGWLLQYRTTIFDTKYDYGTEFFDVKGPADTPNLYTGKMKFDGPRIRTQEGDGSGGLRGDSSNNQWVKGGWVAVKYPASADEVQVADGELNTPLPFHAQPTSMSYRQSTDAWY